MCIIHPGHLALQETECPLRLAVCQHCDLELSVVKLKEHEDYCGARTELCGSCGRNVLVKELKTHPEVCGRVEEEKRTEAAIPPEAYDEPWSQDRIWIASQLLRQIEALDPPMRLPGRPLQAFEADPFYSRTTSQRSMAAQFPVQNNLCELCLALESGPPSQDQRATGLWRQIDLDARNMTVTG